MRHGAPGKCLATGGFPWRAGSSLKRLAVSLGLLSAPALHPLQLQQQLICVFRGKKITYIYARPVGLTA